MTNSDSIGYILLIILVGIGLIYLLRFLNPGKAPEREEEIGEEGLMHFMYKEKEEIGIVHDIDYKAKTFKVFLGGKQTTISFNDVIKRPHK